MAAWEYEYYLTALADNIRTLARPSNILYKSGLLQDPCMINRDRDFRLTKIPDQALKKKNLEPKLFKFCDLVYNSWD